MRAAEWLSRVYQIAPVRRGCDRTDAGKEASINIGRRHVAGRKEPMKQMASVKLQAGDAAPELHFLARDGEKRQLSKLWAEDPALVLWLRHLG
jgi:hypothetical protein